MVKYIYLVCFLFGLTYGLPSDRTQGPPGSPNERNKTQPPQQQVNQVKQGSINQQLIQKSQQVNQNVNVTAEEGAAAASTGNETMEFDFVNLPGYGVIDDYNSSIAVENKDTNLTFSCYGRRYGYYADMGKDCLMFHLCYPLRSPYDGEIIYQRFSFVCSDNAVFDQQNLVCVENETMSINCAQSADYYDASNDKLIESLQQSQGLLNFQNEGEETAVEEDDDLVNNNSTMVESSFSSSSSQGSPAPVESKQQ